MQFIEPLARFGFMFMLTMPHIVGGELPLNNAAIWSGTRTRRHGNVVAAEVVPSVANSSTRGPLSHELTPGGDEFRQLVADKGGGARGPKAGGVGRHHGTPLDHTWPSPEKCVRAAKCEPLINATCFGVPLPYSHTTVELVNDSSSQFEIQERLELWQGLRQIPRCWAVVQPLLCAVYRPRCADGLVTLPSHETCRLVRGFCRITTRGVPDQWPFFLRCQQEGTFSSGCKDSMREIKFNTSGRCAAPLVGTPRETSWYPEVEGCGIGCRHPLLTEDERTSMRTFVGVIVSLATVACLFAVLTFLIGWRESRQYPNVMVFYMNLCLLFMCIGWLAQFLPGAREDIICRRDRTLRSGEPSSGENLSCVAIFFLCYYFLLAALCWLVLLAYAWEHRLQLQGGTVPQLQAKAAYFHLVAWSVPFVLFIVVMALGLVDGDPVSGICFVTAANPHARSALVLVPVTAAFLAGGYFLVRELYKLICLKGGHSDMINDRVRAKIQSMILRIGLFLVSAVLLVSCTYVCHIYEFRNQPIWESSLHNYIACRANVEAAQRPVVPELPVHVCEPDARPSLAMLQLHLVAFLGACLALASWVLTSATAATWRHFWCRTVLRRPPQDPPRVQRHKLVAEAFTRRHELSRGGHGSISFHSAHDDPVGMTLDMNSVTSQDLSSTWAAALPGFLHRRGAVAGPSALPPVRRYSSTSDVSRQLSLSVRRQSLDSQMSYQVAAEQHWLAAQRAIARHQRRKTRRERERLLHMGALHRPSPFPHPAVARRGSDSSMQSLVAAAASSTLHCGLPAAAAKPSSVARATSTGDLNPGCVLSQNHLSLLRPSAAAQRRGEPLINPPFTHGMSESGATRLSMRHSAAAQSSAADSSSAMAASGSSATAQAGQSNPAALQMPGMIPGYPALAAANPYAAYLNYLNGLRVPGHPPSEAALPHFGYPAPFGYPGFPFYAPGLYPPYGQGFASYPDFDPAHTPLIPLHPMPDSASETGFIPIITSDSDFTDAGIRSPHVLSARHVVEERERALAATMASLPRPQTHQETQTDDHQETVLTPTPLRKSQNERSAAAQQQQPETIEMREIKSNQSRWSNTSALSKARMSKSPPGQHQRLSSQASRSPLHRFSSVSPPVTQSPAALSPLVQQQQRESVSPRCCDNYQAVAVHESCGSNNNNTHLANLNSPPWPACHQQVHQGLQHCSCPLYNAEVPLHSPSHNSGYQQGMLCMDQYPLCPGLASGSTEPNTLDSTTSGHSNSDGPHSCHTYLFAPVDSAGNGCAAHSPEPCHQCVAAVQQPQEQLSDGHHAISSPPQRPPFSGCCEGSSTLHQPNASGGPQGLAEPGFVSR
ncbi:smoothened, frizzled class receptor isoform X2 [Amblyomma americanum]